MQAAERSQLRRLLFSDFNRRRGVAMSIIVSISAVQTHTPDVVADEMSNSRRSPSLIPVSVGVYHPCCRKPHGSLRNFSLTGTIFLSIPSLFARIQSSRSQYFTSTNHLSCGFCLNFLVSTFYRRLASKASMLSDLLWLVPRPRRHTPRLIVMHVVVRSPLKIFEYRIRCWASTQAAAVQ